jgi:hypothetical protein
MTTNFDSGLQIAPSQTYGIRSSGTYGQPKYKAQSPRAKSIIYYPYFKGKVRKLTTSRCCSPLMSTASKLTTEHAKDGNVISSFTKDNSQRIIKLSIDQKINPVC